MCLQSTHLGCRLYAPNFRIVRIRIRDVVDPLCSENNSGTNEAVDIKVVKLENGVPFRQPSQVQNSNWKAALTATVVVQQPATVVRQREALLLEGREEQCGGVGGVGKHVIGDAGGVAKFGQHKSNGISQTRIGNVLNGQTSVGVGANDFGNTCKGETVNDGTGGDMGRRN